MSRIAGEAEVALVKNYTMGIASYVLNFNWLCTQMELINELKYVDKNTSFQFVKKTRCNLLFLLQTNKKNREVN